MGYREMRRPVGRQLWYAAPARNFNEALPIGNGRLGAMVQGGIGQETLPINDDCFWAGRGAPEPSPYGPANLARVRERLGAGDHAEAERIVEETLLTGFNQPYLPAAELRINWPETTTQTYRRSLDLGSAIAEVTYGDSSRPMRRRYLASPVDQVIAIQAEHVTGPVELSLTAKVRHRLVPAGGDLGLYADAPAEVIWPGVDDRYTTGEGISYIDPPPRQCVTMIRVLADGSQLAPMDNGFHVTADTFTILIATAASDQHADPFAECRMRLDEAAALGFAELEQRHVAAHASLFARMDLTLGAAPAPDLPTDERLLQHAKHGTDTDLEALLFDYGRYLLISSSRPGCQPANLQGIWNDRVQPPSWSNYTLNINLEMNYWPAEVCNLAECHSPLFDFIGELARSGVHYGMDGWVAHHQTDYLRQTTPVGYLPGYKTDKPARYAMWPMAGGWLCQHLWQHYLYGGNACFLRNTAWPLMRSAALFFLDWLVELPDGTLTTSPSTSPENLFLTGDGKRLGVSKGSAMDRSILREHFETCLSAAAVLDLSGDGIVPRLQAALARLPALEIGGEGQIMERDQDWAEGEHQHRHVSQLYGVFPGNAITPEATPQLAAAARRTLELRGESGTGWSFAWKIAIWARLGDGARAHAALGRLLNPVPAAVTEPGNSGGGVYPNLLMACPPFQIDANFGFTAAVAEMLMQSSPTRVVLLPALPNQWPDGQVRGLRCRGQVELDLDWTGGRPTAVTLRSAVTQDREICFGDHRWTVRLHPGRTFALDLGGCRWGNGPDAIGSAA